MPPEQEVAGSNPAGRTIVAIANLSAPFKTVARRLRGLVSWRNRGYPTISGPSSTRSFTTRRPSPRGLPRVSSRACLTGILFVLKSSILWEMLPVEMGCGSGVTCWRRLRDWQDDGVWDRLHQPLLHRLSEADQIDSDRAALDSASVPAKRKALR